VGQLLRVKQSTLNQRINNLLSGFDIRAKPERDCFYWRQESAILAFTCKTQQIDPRLKERRLKELHLGIVKGSVIEAKPIHGFRSNP
jgi:hypothetical protein